MITFVICLLISILLSFGMSVALIEKGNEYPIRKYKLLLKLFIHDHISWKFCQVLDCTVCCSFWLTIISDCILFLLFFPVYFFWPFSGFITLGFTWVIIEFLNSLDKKQDINIFTEK